MTQITLTNDITVQLLKVCATDRNVLDAARVSTMGDLVLEQLVEEGEVEGVVKYLMKYRHGTPFEHNMFRFFVNAPIFVWREWHRRRIGFSYNEESARYTKLKPVFYLPPPDRPMMKVDGWKPGKPKFLRCTSKDTYEVLCGNLTRSYELAYRMYEANLNMNIDPGLARDCLPVGIYSSCWVTCNARSLMAFLSLRTHVPTARDISYPLYEIEPAALQVETALSQHMPITYHAFCNEGRRAP